MFSFLHKPFPVTRFQAKNLLTYFFIGCFVGVFLIVFQPFGISEWETPRKTLKLLGFGLVSFLAPIAVHLFISVTLPEKITEDGWKVWKEILVVMAVLCCVALGNLLYGYFLGVMPLSIRGFTGALISTLLLGVFPVSYHVSSKHNKLLKVNTEEASKINHLLHPAEQHGKSEGPGASETLPHEVPSEPKLILLSENGREEVQLHPDQLLYIESADNYSNIVFIENGGIKKQMLRGALKRLESQITIPYITRCHRTFIANLKNVDKVSGNAAGYKLSFKHIGQSIPVSRSYANQVFQTFKEIRP
jgi:hypothetical protein